VKAQLTIVLVLGLIGMGFSPYHTESGMLVRWYSQSVTVVYDSQGTPDVEGQLEFFAIDAARTTWNEVACPHPTLLSGGTVDGKKPAQDKDLNLLYFWQDAQGWNKEHADAGTTVIALTTLYYDPNTGAIHNFDMEFADFSHEFTVTDVPQRVGYDLQAVCTHEFGHALGLDHSSDPSATMYAKITVGDTSMRTLSDDDMAGLCSIYGSKWGAVSEQSGGGGGGGCQIRKTTAPPLFLLFVFLLLLARTNRRVFFAVGLGLTCLNFKAITTETGKEVKWGFGHVSLQIDLSQSRYISREDAGQVVQTAFGVWNDVPWMFCWLAWRQSSCWWS
jgi:hypothetical protein